MKILQAVDGRPCTKRVLAYRAAHNELLGNHHEPTVLTLVAPVSSSSVDSTTFTARDLS
ncbi:MAG: hypothetical protein ABI605_14335 [Rhizobacter sp.]